MFIKTCKRKKDKKVYVTQYLVEGYRDKDGKVKHRHLLSLSKLPDDLVLVLKNYLKERNGEEVDKVLLDNLKLIASKEFGSVKVFDKIFDQNFKKTINKKYYNEIKAIVINKIFDTKSKNSLKNWLKKVDFDFEIKNKNKLYEAMDYLEENQEKIEKNLSEKNKINECDILLYDITSTYFEGKGAENICKYGYSRDHRGDRLQINIGLVTDKNGNPVSVEIFEGNRGDKTTLKEQINNLKQKFKIKNITMIFDRGMKSKMNLEYLEKENIDYITALSHSELKRKAEEDRETGRSIQASIFDKNDLVEFYDEIENKKYVLSYNDPKAIRDKETRIYLIEKTEKRLIEIQNFKRKYKNRELQDRVSKTINKFSCEKYISYEIKNKKLKFKRKQEVIDRDEKYDGFYMVESTNIKIEGSELENKYKSLQLVERAFDSVKNHIEIRPVFHYKESRIRGHVFSCFMSYLLLHQFKENVSDLLKQHTLDNLLSELQCIHQAYFEIRGCLLKKVTVLNEVQENILSKFKIACCK